VPNQGIKILDHRTRAGVRPTQTGESPRPQITDFDPAEPESVPVRSALRSGYTFPGMSLPILPAPSAATGRSSPFNSREPIGTIR